MERVETADGDAGDRVEVAGISIEPDKRKVSVRGEPVDLTPREFDLLLHFARHPGRVYTRSELLDRVWGYQHGGYEHTVNSHINRLRAKVEADPEHPACILTVWGVGYKFAEPGEREG
jgi:DNA-binding response OmpR family regulator